MELEITQLELRYAGLRIKDAGRVSRLAVSLMEQGQQTPVLVVSAGYPDGYVLVDGYARVEALRRLGQDTVQALVLRMDATEALVLAHRLECARRRTALEEGWLLKVLVEEHHLEPQAVARKLLRSPSWVSRRLALVRELPPAVQDRVRAGTVAAHAAMKGLVPLARANRVACERLGEVIAEEGLTTREAERLCTGFRQGDAKQREQILSHPRLYLRAAEEVARKDPPLSGDPEDLLVRDVEALGGLCRRVRQRLVSQPRERSRRRLERTWRETSGLFAGLAQDMEEVLDAGRGHADGGARPARPGTRDEGDRRRAEDLPQRGQAHPPQRPGGGAEAGTGGESG
ncbi:MAG: hypothetical protein FJ255_12815 [Phycisphaerae bacterium]|nr:hypothetical protein [Phycisphaerae bacterium]